MRASNEVFTELTARPTRLPPLYSGPRRVRRICEMKIASALIIMVMGRQRIDASESVRRGMTGFLYLGSVWLVALALPFSL